MSVQVRKRLESLEMQQNTCFQMSWLDTTHMKLSKSQMEPVKVPSDWKDLHEIKLILIIRKQKTIWRLAISLFRANETLTVDNDLIWQYTSWIIILKQNNKHIYTVWQK